MNNPQIWQAVAAVIAAYAALLGGLYAVVTRPIEGRLHDLSQRLDTIEQRLQKIEERLTDFGERIARLEERVPPLVHR